MEYIFIALISLLGIILSNYLWKKKNSKGKLVCVIGKDCKKVIDSKYSKIFGIDNIILGLLYYIFILFLSISAIAYSPLTQLNLFYMILLVSSSISLIVSLYLTSIQIFVIKDLCEYCLASAIINLMLFLIILI